MELSSRTTSDVHWYMQIENETYALVSKYVNSELFVFSKGGVIPGIVGVSTRYSHRQYQNNYFRNAKFTSTYPNYGRILNPAGKKSFGS